MKTTVSETFLNKVAGCKPAALLKRNSDTDFLL